MSVDHSNPYAAFTKYELRYIVFHILHSDCDQRLGNAERILMDLRFVQAKCEAGMLHSLINDYNTALSVLPPLSRTSSEAETAHGDLMTHYVADLVAYSRASVRALRKYRSAVKERSRGKPTVVLPRPPRTTSVISQIYSTGQDRGMDEDSLTNRTVSDRIQAFRNFVSTHSSLLSGFPAETMSIARNHATGGPVAEQANRLLAERRDPWFSRDPRPPCPSSQPLCRFALKCESDRILYVSVTADGRFALSATPKMWNRAPFVQMWDLSTGECVKTLTGIGTEVNAISATPDAKKVVAVVDNCTLRVWDLQTGRCIKAFAIECDSIRSIAITPDGMLAVIAESKCAEEETPDPRRPGKIPAFQVWDLIGRHRMWSLGGPVAGPNVVGMGANGWSALSWDSYGVLRVWDITTGLCSYVLKGEAGTHCALAVTPDGEKAVSSGYGLGLCVWNLVERKYAAIPLLIGQDVISVAITPDGRICVSGGADGKLRVWDLIEVRCLRTIECQQGSVNCVAVTPDGKLAVSGGNDGTLRVWDLAAGREPRSLKKHSNIISRVKIASNRHTALSEGWDGSQCWDFTTGEHLKDLSGRTEGEEGYIYNDGLLNMKSDGYNAIYNVWGGAAMKMRSLHVDFTIRTIEGPSRNIECVATTPNGEHLIAYDDNGSCVIWEIDTGRCVNTAPGISARLADGRLPSVRCFTLGSDGRRAFLGLFDRSVRLYDLATGECLRALETLPRNAESISFTPDGRLVLFGGNDASVRLYDIEKWQCLHNYPGPLGPSRIEMTPDGRKAVYASGMQSIAADKLLFIDLSTGQLLRCLVGHTLDVSSIVVTPGGRWAISASKDGTLRVWDLNTGECISIYPIGESISAMSEVCPDGRFICGTDRGSLHFLTLKNLPDQAPKVTATRLFNWNTLEALRETKTRNRLEEPANEVPANANMAYDEKLTSSCLWCGRRFVPSDVVLDAIYGILRNAKISNEHSPCRELPADAWNEARLISECPHCHRPLRFNPFTHDNRYLQLLPSSQRFVSGDKDFKVSQLRLLRYRISSLYEKARPFSKPCILIVASTVMCTFVPWGWTLGVPLALIGLLMGTILLAGLKDLIIYLPCPRCGRAATLWRKKEIFCRCCGALPVDIIRCPTCLKKAALWKSRIVVCRQCGCQRIEES